MRKRASDTAFAGPRRRTAKADAGIAAEVAPMPTDPTAGLGDESSIRLALEASPVAALMIDETGQVLLVNVEAENLFGYRRDELLGRPVEMLVPERYRGRHAAQRGGFVAAPEARRMGAGRELFALHRDGREIAVEVALGPVQTPQGLRIVAAVADISERRRAQEELRRLNESLEARIAERTAVARRRAADLRRLAAALGRAEHEERRRIARVLHDDLQQLLLAARMRLAQLASDDPAERWRSVAAVEELLGDCLGITRDLTRDLSPPVLEFGSLVEVVEWVARRFGETHGLEVEIEARKALPTCPEHVRVFIFRAVRELLLNVVKHSGKLHARVVLDHADGMISVEVQDGGDGFDPKVVEATLERPESFGLFNIRERLEDLGGRLDILRAPGGGARIRLVLPGPERPVADGEDAPAEVAAPDGRAAAAGKRAGAIRLLVVDDHELVRKGLVRLLDEQGDLSVVGEAANGAEALRQANELRPHAVVMDVEMPQMSGIETTRRLRSLRPEISVVGLSIHGDAAVRQAMVEAGAVAHVCKLAPPAELVEAIRRAHSASEA